MSRALQAFKQAEKEVDSAARTARAEQIAVADHDSCVRPWHRYCMVPFLASFAALVPSANENSSSASVSEEQEVLTNARAPHSLVTFRPLSVGPKSRLSLAEGFF